jgi:hypothetical protein
MAAKFADPNAVLIYFAGNRLQGYADGEFLTYERMSPGFNDVVGTDGEVARSKTNDFRVKIVVKLLQTSASNLVLSTIHNNDLNSPNGAGVATMLIQDLQGFTYLQGPQAWIVQFPNGSWDRSAKSREWEFRMAQPLIYVEGGD